MTGDKDGRCCEITGAQGRNEIEPAHPRHVLIDDVAVAGWERRFREELRAAGEYANREPLDDEGEFQRVANRFVVIDDNDEISALIRLGLTSPRLRRPKDIDEDSDRPLRRGRKFRYRP